MARFVGQPPIVPDKFILRVEYGSAFSVLETDDIKEVREHVMMYDLVAWRRAATGKGE